MPIKLKRNLNDKPSVGRIFVAPGSALEGWD